MIGTVVAGRYQLDAMIGSGGTGTVFRALDLRLQRPIAIKLQHRGGEVALARLQREARIAALVQTAGMLRILDVGQDGELAYLAMELLDGETLHARATRHPPDLSRALGWTASCAKTMAAVHAHGIVHRDLKPDNLFLDTQATAEVLVVLDFGLAFATEHEDPALGRLSDPDQTAGTPTYMPPEQICDAEVGPPADVYALGCVLYELLVGEPPYSGDRAQLLASHLYAAPPPVRERSPWAPPEVEVLLQQMLGKSPGRRPTMPMVADQCRAIARFHTARAEGERPESRSTRAVTLPPPRAARTPAPTEAGSRRVLVLASGTTDGELAIALAANDMELTMDPGAPRDVVLALDLPEADLAAWLASDTPVLASAPSGDLDRAMHLVQQGAADVVTTPVRGDVVARKLLRILRERARRTR